MPCSLMRRIKAKSSSTRSGERPSDGSSRMSKMGSAIRPRPIASICCSPPERLPARCACRSARRGKIPKTFSRFCCRRLRARRYPPSSRLSLTLRLGKTQRPSGTWMSPRETIAAGFSCSIACPAKTIEPFVARSTPEIVRLSVDLPTPFDPSTATISPAPTIRSTPCRTWVSPYPACRSPTLSSALASMLRSQLCRRATTEVRLNDQRIRNNFRRRALGNDPAFGEHEHVLGETHHRLHDMFDHQYSDATAAKIADDRPDVTDLGGMEPRQHFIEQKHLRFGSKRTRKFEPLAPGDGQGVGRLVEHLAKPYIAADLVSSRERRIAFAMTKMGPDQYVFADREPIKRLHDLKCPGDSASREAVWRLAGNVLTGKMHGALVG